MIVWRAGWVLPITGPPLRDGAVAMDDGVIVDVGRSADVCARAPDVTPQDLGDDAILMPGLVDAHCHLEWSCFDGIVGPRPFARWLGAFLPLRACMDGEDDHRAAALHGAARALAAGTTTLADSGPTGAGVDALTRVGLRGVVHLEAFGTGDDAGEAEAHAAALATRVAELDRRAASAGGRVAVGVSPHAPYSAGPVLWRALRGHADLARRAWATHIAESPDEDDAILRRTGELADLFAAAQLAVGRWDGAGGVASRMDAAGALVAGLVAAHCVRVDAADAARLRARGAGVAHCPRSNAYLRCGTAPLRVLDDADVPVGLGTDSPASGGDYDLRAEARACRAAHGPAAPDDARLLRMITADAAQVLGLAGHAGALAPGRPADLLVLRRAPGSGAADPHTAALDAGTTVDTVMVGGAVLREAGVTLGSAARTAGARAAVLRERLRDAVGPTPAADMP